MNRETTHEQPSDWVRTAVEAHQPALVRYVRRLLDGDDRARDVVQDVFVKLMAQPQETVADHLPEWLFTACRNRALDLLRKEGRMKHFEPGQAEAVPSEDPRPGRGLERNETQAALLGLIGRLPPAQQEVVRLKFQNGFSYKEIARITDRSVSHVGVLLHDALMRLRSEFATQRT